jgi:hypothetical protein
MVYASNSSYPIYDERLLDCRNDCYDISQSHHPSLKFVAGSIICGVSLFAPPLIAYTVHKAQQCYQTRLAGQGSQAGTEPTISSLSSKCLKSLYIGAYGYTAGATLIIYAAAEGMITPNIYAKCQELCLKILDFS